MVDRFSDRVLLGKIVDAEHVLFLPTGLWRHLSGLGAKASKLPKHIKPHTGFGDCPAPHWEFVRADDPFSVEEPCGI